MSQQKLYQFCNYSVMSGITVTFSTGATFNNDYYVFQCHTVNSGHTVSFTLSHALSEDLIVYYDYDYTNKENGVITGYGTVHSQVYFHAGETVKTFNVTEYSYYKCPNGITYQDYLSNYILLGQPSLPTSCSGQPSGCTVQYSGYTITAPSIRGAVDGSITLGITGTTGSTIVWKLNGVNVFTGSSHTHIFTGLTSGIYSVSAFEGFCYTQVQDIVVPEGQFITGDFIIDNPSSVSAANNPIILQIETARNTFSPQPSKGKIIVTSGATIMNNDTLTFTFTYPQSYEAQFTAKDYPNKNTYFLSSSLTNSVGTVVGSNTAEEIATSIAEVLQQDSVIRRLYYITNDSNAVYLTAKQNNPNLDFTSNLLTISSTGITYNRIQDGVSEFDGEITQDYSLYAEVYVDPSLEYGATPNPDNFIRVAELELPYQSIGEVNQHKFQLDTVLNNFVDTPRLNDFTFTGFTTVPDHDVAYFVKYGEKFPLITNSTTKKKRYKGQTTYLHAVNSSLDWEQANDMDSYLGVECTGLTATTGSYPLTGVTFLTNSPDILYVQRNSKQYLSFILERNYASSGRTLSCRGDVYFYDGSSSTGLTFFNITSGNTTNFGGMTMLSVGYDGLGLAALEQSGNTKVRRVDFAVYQTDVNGSYALTETKSYLYEIDEAPTRYGTIFLNKLGAWDLYDWCGEIIYDEEISRETLQKARTINADGSSPYGFEANSVYDTQYTRKVTVNSSNIDEDTYEWLQELLQSNRIYCYTSTYQPYLMVENFTAQKSTNNTEYTIQVVFKETLFRNNVRI